MARKINTSAVLKVSVSILVMAVVGASVFFYEESRQRNRADRLYIYRNLVESQQVDLAQGVLLGLIKDYPQDAEVKDQLRALAEWLAERDSAAEAARLAEIKQWQQNYQDVRSQVVACQEAEKVVQSRLRTLQNKTDAIHEGNLVFQDRSTTFQNQVVDYQESDRQFKVAQSAAEQKKLQTDYLYNLLGEKANEKNLLPQQEVANLLTNLTSKTELLNYPELLAKSAGILRADPFNAKAAVLWAYGMAKSSPDSSVSRTKILPVVDYILQDNPTDARANQVSAIIHYFAGDYAIAEQRYKLANAVQPNDASIIEGYILSLEKNQKYAEASALAKAYWNNSRKDKRTALLVWESLAQSGTADKKSFLEEWRLVDSSSNLPDSYEGDMALEQGDKAGAILSYQKANQIKESPKLVRQIAELSFATGEYSVAQVYAQKAFANLKIDVASEKADYLKFGRINILSEYELHRFADVIKDGEAYLKSGVEDSLVQVDVALSYKKSGNSDKALGLCIQIYKNGNRVMIGKDLIAIYMEKKSYNEALAVCKELGKENLPDEYREFVANAQKTIEEKKQVVKK